MNNQLSEEGIQEIGLMSKNCDSPIEIEFCDAAAKTSEAMQDGIQKLPPIDRETADTMLANVKCGLFAHAEAAVRECRERQLSEALSEKTKLSTRVDELLAEATKATEELARVREENVQLRIGVTEFSGDADAPEIELARERELVSELRQVVKEYRKWMRNADGCDIYYGGVPNGSDQRCSTCIKADALLTPLAPEPVDTQKEG